MKGDGSCTFCRTGTATILMSIKDGKPLNRWVCEECFYKDVTQ